MKRITLVFLAALACGGAAYAPSPARAETISGTLQALGPQNRAVNVQLGQRVRFDISFFTEARGTIVNARLRLHNRADTPVFAYCYVAFFDKDKNLLGADSSQPGQPLKAGQHDLSLMHCELPPAEAAKIHSYQVTVYESDKPLD